MIEIILCFFGLHSVEWRDEIKSFGTCLHCAKIVERRVGWSLH